MTSDRWVRPSRAEQFQNKMFAVLPRLGIGVAGARVLAVRGRTSGRWRTAPVFPIEVGGGRYLVAPRGHTQWVRNMRAAGGGELRIGPRREAFTAAELPDAGKPPILRAYLKRYRFLDRQFFAGIGADVPDGKLREIAPGYPVFRLSGRHPA